MKLRNRNKGSTVDTRVGGQRVQPSRTQSEWVDAADTSRFKRHYVCQYCKKECSRAAVLARHMKDNCLRNPTSKCNTDLSRPFVCHQCGRRFKVIKSLTYHERHECQKFVICRDCNQTLVGATVPIKHIALCQKKMQFGSEKLTDVELSEIEEDRYSELILSTTDDNSD